MLDGFGKPASTGQHLGQFDMSLDMGGIESNRFSQVLQAFIELAPLQQSVAKKEFSPWILPRHIARMPE